MDGELKRVFSPAGSIAVFARLFAAGLAALLSVTACVSDPGGSADPDPVVEETPGLDTLPLHKLLLKADEHVRRGEYAQAMAVYDAALARDSSLSRAYYGHATAVVLFYGLDRMDILADFEAMSNDPSTFPFLDKPDSILTLRLQVASRVRSKLAMLTDRDSLTRWHRYLTDSVPSAEALADPLYAARRAFMQTYLVRADLGVPGHRRADKFPLSDLKFAASNVALDYALFELLYTITRLYDLDGNDTIDARDSLMKKLRFEGSGGFGIDSLNQIANDLEGDSVAAANLNALLVGMQSGLLGTSSLAQLIGPSGGSGSGSGEGEQSESIDSVIASLGDAILFYQFGDKLDNDGDGCIDEEILDEKDNDLDGFVDEDARVIPADKPDLVDNDHNGKMDPFHFPTNTNPALVDSGEAPVGVAVSASRPHVLGFVHKYLVSNELGLSDNLTTWVKIKKDAPPEQMKVRLDIQKDSLAVKVARNGGVAPDSLTVKIQHAKAAIGGCWRNY